MYKTIKNCKFGEAFEEMQCCLDEYILGGYMVNVNKLLKAANEFAKCDCTSDPVFSHDVQGIQRAFENQSPWEIYKKSCALFFNNNVSYDCSGRVMEIVYRNAAYNLDCPRVIPGVAVLVDDGYHECVYVKRKRLRHISQLPYNRYASVKNGITVLGKINSNKNIKAKFQYCGLRFDWAWLVWYDNHSIVPCPYTDDSLKYIFDSMRVKE